MIRRLTLMILALSTNIFSFAETTIAHTENGIAIILDSDGTWKAQTSAHENEKKRSAEGFRKAKWGDSIDQVKKTEDGEVKHTQEGIIGYETTVAGLDVLTAFIFIENQLVRGKYVILETHTNANDFIQDYDKITTSLEKKYGKPIQDVVLWKNDLYKDDYEHWGMALQVGHLAYVKKWETEETTIVVLLNGDNYEVSFAIEYSGKGFESLRKAKAEQENLDVL